MNDNELAQRLSAVFDKGRKAHQMYREAKADLEKLREDLKGREIVADPGGGKGTYKLHYCSLSYDGATLTGRGSKVKGGKVSSHSWEITGIGLHTLGLSQLVP